MSSVKLKLKRMLTLALATVFCLGASVIPNNIVSAKTSSYNEPNVRVGMYVSAPLLDSRLNSAVNKSSSGFDIGYTSGDSFNKLFSLTQTEITLIPQANSDIGAYSAVIGKFSSFNAAYNAAKSKKGFVAVVKNGYEARAFASKTAEEAKKASCGKQIASPASGAIYLLDANKNIIVSFEDASHTLALRGHNGGAVNMPLRHRTGSINYYDFSGIFEYAVSDNLLWMENIIGLEAYTKCVMANEIGTNFSPETRKAFAVLARTVPLNKKHQKQGFDVCTNSACCQVYHGLYRMSAENNAIVEATHGLVCTYQGAPILVLYHNSNGGASCSSVAAWGGNEIPYLTTVFQDEYDEGDKWNREFSKSEFFEYLSSRNSFSSLKDENISMKILETDPYGSDYITILSVSDGSGNVINIETSEDVRSAVGFTSANFTLDYSTTVKVLTENGIVEEREISGIMTQDGYKPFEGFGESYKTVQGVEIAPDKVTVNGAGVGHGVGFSATGSEKLAKDGYSYQYILNFFFNGTELKYAA